MDFQTALAGFLKAAQAKVDDRMRQYAPTQAVVLEIQEGLKYVRVVAVAAYNGRRDEHGSAYCFVDKTTGDVLKPAGYKGPEKRNPRSNIFAQDFGASGVTGYGTTYLR